MSKKLIILDHNLQNYNGHYWEYDSMMTRLFLCRGFAPFIFAHKNFKQKTPLEKTEVYSWFSLASADIYRPALYNKIVEKTGPLPRPVWRLLRFFYRLLKPLVARKNSEAPPLPFGKECFDALKKVKADKNDIVFFQAVYEREIENFTTLFLEQKEKLPRFAIMLRRDPREDFMKNCWRPITKLTPYIQEGQIVLFTDTPELKKEYEEVLNLPVFDLPVLHDLTQILENRPQRQEAIPRFVYLGNAREEKGFHLLPTLVTTLSAKHKCEFHLQAYIPDDEYVPRIIKARDALRKMGNVSLFEEALSEADYINLLLSGDVVLLPYEAKAYQNRSSGILMQAVTAGKVLIVPENCWLSKHAPKESTLTFAPGRLEEAAENAITNLEDLRKAAEKAKETHVDQSLSEAFFQKFMEAFPA